MPAKRILLMYISEVSGHRSAAMAVAKALKILRPDIEIMDINAFNYTNPISEKVINTLYMNVIKNAPQIWDYLYDNPDIIKRIEKFKKAVHKFNSPKLISLFEQFKPDVVACTQAFPCGMVADYKADCNSHLPLVAVLTDYAPHSYWIYDTVDYYITPAQDVSQRLIKKGVPENKIMDLGIPFDQKFNQPCDRNKIFQKLKLNPDLPTILIMGGGQGLGPIKTILKSMEKIKKEIQEIVVCGTNKKLHGSLEKKLHKYKKRIALFGFSQNVHELMSISDMIISKPGGVTAAESLSKEIPMIIVNPLPGQEANNTAYLTEKGTAIKVEAAKTINLVIEDLLENPLKLSSFRESILRIRKPNASFDIAKLLIRLANA